MSLGFDDRARANLASGAAVARHDASVWSLRAKRDAAAAQVPDFEALRTRAAAIKDHVLDHLDAYLERYRDLRGDTRFEYALLFRNHGRTAGASLSHPHSQLIALPVVPKRAREELEAAEKRSTAP